MDGIEDLIGGQRPHVDGDGRVVDMSYLGNVLGLDYGSRLSGFGPGQLACELPHEEGMAYLHVLMLPAGDDPTDASEQYRSRNRRGGLRSTRTTRWRRRAPLDTFTPTADIRRRHLRRARRAKEVRTQP